jgi:two-component system response regulator MprA
MLGATGAPRYPAEGIYLAPLVPVTRCDGIGPARSIAGHGRPNIQRMTRVLVIDDEPAIADVLRMLLEFRGHDVVVANDGSRGYATAQRQAPDVIVLDLMMPVMDGFATLGALRHDERTATIPVVILSALSSVEVRQRCHDMGVRTFLQKPYKAEDLLRAVEGSQLVDANG